MRFKDPRQNATPPYRSVEKEMSHEVNPDFDWRFGTAGIAVAAIRMAILQRDLFSTRFLINRHVFIISVVPMACLLVWGLIIGCGGLIRRGECHPFLVGFEVFGWAALFLTLAYDASADQYGLDRLGFVAPVARRVLATETLKFRDMKVLLFHMTIFLLPALAFSLAGGWWSQRLGIRVVSWQQGAGCRQGEYGRDPRAISERMARPR